MEASFRLPFWGGGGIFLLRRILFAALRSKVCFSLCASMVKGKAFRKFALFRNGAFPIAHSFSLRLLRRIKNIADVARTVRRFATIVSRRHFAQRTVAPQRVQTKRGDRFLGIGCFCRAEADEELQISPESLLGVVVFFSFRPE